MMADQLTVGSLCTGYGGLDLALKAHFNTRVIWTSEIDRHASRVVKARYRAPNLGDLKLIDWEAIEAPDIITAGYPCQPFSYAGGRNGTQDPRHIWPWIAEGIRHLRPRLAVMENVQGHLTKGFGEVIGTLASMGYDATWGCVRASDAGAPHRRTRLFVVATPHAGRERHGWEQDGGVVGSEAGGVEGEARQQRARQVAGHRSPVDEWSPAPTVGGWLSPLFVEWMMGLRPGWVTGVPGLSRGQQLKILGNGVVPQQAALALHHLLPLALAPSRQRAPA